MLETNFIYLVLLVDASQNIFVVDHQNHRVQIFDQNGLFLHKFGGKGDENGQFKRPSRNNEVTRVTNVCRRCNCSHWRSSGG